LGNSQLNQWVEKNHDSPLTVGNGNNFITDPSTSGTVAITVGTGYNLIDISAGFVATYNATVTLGAHTTTTALFDEVMVGTVAGAVVLPSTVITGAVAGDMVYVTAATSVAQATTAQQTAITAQVTLGAAINAAVGYAQTAGQTIAFQYGGNTYLYTDAVGGPVNTTGNGDTLVEVVGVHTVSSTLALTHGIVLAS